MQLINWEIAGHPYNWVLIWVIALFWLAVLAVIFPPHDESTAPLDLRHPLVP